MALFWILYSFLTFQSQEIHLIALIHLDIIYGFILDNVTDINLKCSGYKFCHLKNSLVGFWYVFFFVFLVNALYPMWILFSLEMLFLFHNYIITMVFYIIILWNFCCCCISILSQESCFGRCRFLILLVES